MLEGILGRGSETAAQEHHKNPLTRQTGCRSVYDK